MQKEKKKKRAFADVHADRAVGRMVNEMAAVRLTFVAAHSSHQ